MGDDSGGKDKSDGGFSIVNKLPGVAGIFLAVINGAGLLVPPLRRVAPCLVGIGFVLGMTSMAKDEEQLGIAVIMVNTAAGLASVIADIIFSLAH